MFHTQHTQGLAAAKTRPGERMATTPKEECNKRLNKVFREKACGHACPCHQGYKAGQFEESITDLISEMTSMRVYSNKLV